MKNHATFGPGGNSVSFVNEGHKHTAEAPEWLYHKGLNAYEYQAGRGLYGTDETFGEIGREADKYNITVSLHAPYYISLTSLDLEKRLNSINYIKSSLNAARLMNAYIIVVHPGTATKISRSDAMDLSKDTLYKTFEAIEADPVLSRNTVCIGLETMGQLNQLGTVDEIIELCKMNPGLLKPVVDFGHVNSRNIGGYFNGPDDYGRLFDTIAQNFDDETAMNLHCHFSKIEYTKVGEKKHLTFADDVYGPAFEPFIEALAKYSLTPNVICESDGTMAEDALAMKHYYEGCEDAGTRGCDAFEKA
jgi:deoxyribonuclease-4